MVASTALMGGERLFFASAEDAGGGPPWIMSWSSIGASDLEPVFELDDVLFSPAPVGFDQGLAGYRQQTPSCYQLMGFAGGSFRALADCLPFWPQELDSSLDRQLITAVISPSGFIADALFEIIELDGGTSPLAAKGLVVGTHAIPLTPDELYWENDLGQMLVIQTTSDETLYDDASLYSTPLPHVVRPGGSFLAEIADDGGVPTVLVTDNGNTTLPFGESWSTPLFSQDGRYVLFAGVPALFDLGAGAEYALPLNPAAASYDARSEKAILVGLDGTLASIDLTNLPSAGSAGTSGQPVGTILEGAGVSAAALTADGKGVVYAGTDPAGRSGLFFEPAR
jgi:hypothetical protein